MDRFRTTPVPLLDLATAAGGVLDRQALVAAGLTEAAIESRVRRGRIRVVHAGVYAVPHFALTIEARWHAALLAVPGAALSHGAAAALWRMGPRHDGPVEVVTTGDTRPAGGPRVHRTRSLPAEHLTVVDGLRVTTPARVLLDMAARWSLDELLRAAGDAEVARVLDYATLMALDTRGRRGGRRVRRLQMLLAEGTRSELERRVRALCELHALPAPTGQLRVAGFRLDLAWPHHRVAVEAQSWRHHGVRREFERDARKQAVLRAAGWEVLPVTWRQLHHRPEEIIRALTAAIGRGVGQNRSG